MQPRQSTGEGYLQSTAKNRGWTGSLWVPEIKHDGSRGPRPHSDRTARRAEEAGRPGLFHF